MAREEEPVFRKVILDAATDGPAVAQYYLSRMKQRKYRKGHVKKLANLMISGEWQNKVGVIKVTKKGFLVEGQHRLRAFIEAAKYCPTLKVSFYIMSGVPDEQAYAVQANVCHWDCGDVIEAAGMDRTIGGIIKLVMSKGDSSRSKFTHEKILEKAKQLSGPVNEVRNAIRALKRVRTAAVVAAIVRGMLATNKRAATMRFCSLLSGADPKSAVERWGRQLYLDLNDEEHSPRNHDEVLRSYLRAETALDGFLKGTPFHGDGIKRARTEVFALPGEAICVPNDGTPRFLVGIRGYGYRSKDETLRKVLTQKAVSLQGKVQRRLPAGSKLALATLADKKVVAMGTVKRIQQTPVGVPEAVLLNVEKTEPKDIDFSKLSFYPRIPNLSKEIVPITASDMENLTA